MIYIVIGIFGIQFLAHRLAFFYKTGRWPPRIDHADQDGMNNRWRNLREATVAQNNANSKIMATNTTGYKGVIVRRKPMRFQARIIFRGKQIHLGTFKTAESASDAYQKAARELYGEFVP